MFVVESQEVETFVLVRESRVVHDQIAMEVMPSVEVIQLKTCFGVRAVDEHVASLTADLMFSKSFDVFG